MKNPISKQTIAFQKQYVESLKKDMEAMVGKAFMLSVAVGPEDDDDTEGDIHQEFVYIEKMDSEDGLIGTTVFLDEDTADVSIGTVIDLNGSLEPCSKNEFTEALGRARRRVEQKIESMKEVASAK